MIAQLDGQTILTALRKEKNHTNDKNYYISDLLMNSPHIISAIELLSTMTKKQFYCKDIGTYQK